MEFDLSKERKAVIEPVGADPGGGWPISVLPILVVLCGVLIKIIGRFYNDSDPLWSMVLGKWIDLHHTVPHIDTFSWTIPGKPWVTGEWLFCWLLYKIHTALGDWGIALLLILVYLVTAYFIFAICYRLNQSYSSIWIAALGSWTLVLFSALPRALIFTFAFLAAQTFLIRYKKESRWLYVLPLMYVVWANIQNTAVFGVGLLLAEAMAGSFLFRNHRLWLVTILSFMATLINPAGIHMWLDVIKFMGYSENKLISEWKAPDFNVKMILGTYVFFAATGLWASLKRSMQDLDQSRLMPIFWFWIAFLYSLSAIRGLDYTLFFWIILMSALTPEWVKRHLNVKPTFGVVVFSIILVVMSTYVFVGKLPLFRSGSSVTPVGSVEFLKRHPEMQDKLFNEYIFGGYLMKEGIKVFIDARATPYTQQGVFADYSRIVSLKESPKPILNKYGVKSILIIPQHPLAIYLQSQSDWKLVYKDKEAMLFVKDSANKGFDIDSME